jgi:hypothetical protein
MIYRVTHTVGYSTAPQTFHMRCPDYFSALERARFICGASFVSVKLALLALPPLTKNLSCEQAHENLS